MVASNRKIGTAATRPKAQRQRRQPWNLAAGQGKGGGATAAILASARSFSIVAESAFPAQGWSRAACLPGGAVSFFTAPAVL
jgi:hypothetical protein